MKHPLKTISLLTASALFSLSSLTAVETDPVGYVSDTLVPGQHILSTPLVKGGVAAGEVDGVSGNDVTLASAVTFSQTEPLYLLVTSGAAIGEVETIVSVSGNTVSLENSISGLSANDSYEVREHYTVGDLTSAAEAASSSLSTGDTVTLYNDDGSVTNYSFNQGDWFLAGGGFEPVNEGIIFPNEGFVLSLNTETDFTWVGEVTTFTTNVDLNNSTFFIVSSNDPSTKTGAESIGSVLEGLGDGSVVTIYSNDGNLNVSETYTLNGGNWFSAGGGFEPVEISVAAPAAVVVNSQTSVSATIPPAYQN